MQQQQTYELWFRIADENKDGVVGGAEAVKFFQRSGLKQDVLGQIWDIASAGGAALTQNQFTTAMRCVAIAQTSGGVLPMDQARLVAMGGGPVTQLPLLNGIDKSGVNGAVKYSPSQQISGFAPQMTGASYAPQRTGVYTPQMTGMYTPQMTGAYSPQITGYPPQMTGYVQQPTGYTPQMTGPAAPGVFPPITPGDLQRYQAMFVQLDKDGDNIVSGADCFGAFLAWGLDKAVLRDIWNVVAGNAGQLSSDQFVKCLYLMDNAKRGMPVPPALPPGPFPPGIGAGTPGAVSRAVSSGSLNTYGAPATAPPPQQQQPQQQPATAWTLQSQFGGKTMTQAMDQAYNDNVPLPTLPTRAEFDAAAGQTGRPQQPSRVPVLDPAVAAGLRPADAARLEAEQQAAAAAESKLRGVESDVEAQRRRTELYQQALSELTVFKSRTDVALLQAQEQASRLQQEAAAAEKRYQAAYQTAQSEAERGTALRTHITGLLKQKTEAEAKLTQMQQELAAMAGSAPEEARRLEAELASLSAQLSAAEARKAGLDLQRDSGRKQKELLQSRIEGMAMAAAAAEAEVHSCRAEVAELAGRARGVRGSSDMSEVAGLLVQTAGAYRKLYQAAQTGGLEIPYEAQLGNVGALTWSEELLAGAADWDDDVDARGFVVVNAFPDLDGTLAGAMHGGFSSGGPKDAGAGAASLNAPPLVPNSYVTADFRGPTNSGLGFEEDAFAPTPAKAPPAAATTAEAQPAAGGFEDEAFASAFPPPPAAAAPAAGPAAPAVAASAAAATPAKGAAPLLKPPPIPGPAVAAAPGGTFGSKGTALPVLAVPAAAAAAPQAFGDDDAFGSAIDNAGSPNVTPPAPNGFDDDASARAAVSAVAGFDDNAF